MKKILLLFILLFAVNCFAQLSKTHYIPPLTSSTSSSVTPQDHYIYISTPSEQELKFKILLIGRNIISDIVSKSKPYRYNIGSGENTQLFESLLNTGKVSNKGLIIESEGLVYVNVRTNSGGGNQAGGLVSKGISGLGKRFRAGAMINSFDIGGLLNFISILATENNTEIKISNITNGTVLANRTVFNDSDPKIKLDKNESYILAINGSQGSKLIGALIESDKDVVVNSGSFGGTNDPTNNPNLGRDLGFDQIVSADKIGKEYIFIRGKGSTETEKVLIIADEPDTEIFLNGSTVAFSKINEGEFITLNGNNYLSGNLYIKTSKKVFAYQSIGGSNSSANQNLFFVPPLNCSTPKIVDYIPKINEIGEIKTYTGVVNIVTQTGAKVYINGTLTGENPLPVNGNPDFVYYSVNSLIGDVAIKSDKQVYVSYYGTDGNATYGSYYSGFDLKPELIIDNSTSILGSCIPNITLKTESDPDYEYQWYQNDTTIPGISGKGNTFTPTVPGYYQVKRSIPSCSTSNPSDKIPVSNCPTDFDGDTVPDNIDLDYDNDGITNCEESFGDLGLDLTGTTIVKNSYSNTFSSSITKNPTTSSASVVGKNNGDFVSEVPVGIGNSIEYKINFDNPINNNKPIAVALEYVNTANATDLIDSNGEFSVKSDSDKTITALNPTNQLLIDTNYDGIFESGVTEYSSFEIRFRLNSTTPLTANTGKFSFQSYQTKSLTFSHKNLSDVSNNKAAFKIKIKCISRDSDADSTPDYLDLDSDNDGIADIIESQPNTAVSVSIIDLNKDGLYDVFGTGTIPQDTDNDTIPNILILPDYLDLDSDNDGIKDEIETDEDQDADGIRNYRDIDRENDGCNDVIEAGYSDGDSNGKYGTAPIAVNQNGLVIGAPYTLPNSDYSTAAPIIISRQPSVSPTCTFQNTSISLTDNGVNSYQWQLLIGTTWNDISNDSTYSGATTNTLTITNVTYTMQGYQYRVVLAKTGNSCGRISDPTTLTVNALPSLSPTDLKQCDDNADGISVFNLTEKNNFISANAATESFTYYTSLLGAQTKDNATLIVNPIAYTNNSNKIWVRVENTNGCFSTTEINLIVSFTQLPPDFKREFKTCDDSITSISTDTDGIAEFDFSSVTQEIENILPPPDPLNPYEIKYYRNEADALAENNPITNSANYRNIGYPNEQAIWVRVESVLDNSCFGLGPRIKLIVNPKPNIDTNEDGQDDTLICLKYTGEEKIVTLDAGLQNGIQSSAYNYKWTKDGNVLTSDKNYIVNEEGTYTVEVSFKETGCAKNRTIKVTASETATINSIDIVDLSEINSVKINATGKGIYEYSLKPNDQPIGSPFQTSNFFENVDAGIYTIYIKDIKNNCGIIEKEIAVLGVPKFFTPNNDNVNDLWNTKGVSQVFNSKSLIYIFDRFGKLLKQLLPSETGWDGTFNGSPLPSDDYWYSIKLEDGRELKGHFSLKR